MYMSAYRLDLRRRYCGVQLSELP